MNFSLLIQVIEAVFETFVFFGIGALAVNRGMIREDMLAGLSRFAVNILSPILIFHSIAGNYSREELAAAWSLPLTGFGMIALHAVFAFLLLPFLLRDKTPERRVTFLHMMAVNNYLFLPLIVIRNLWGAKAVAALMVWNVGSTCAYWTIGVGVMARGGWKKLFRNILSPNFYAILAAMAVVATACPLPATGMRLLGRIGDLAVPLNLVVIGASLYASRRRMADRPLDLIFATGARLLLIPLLTLALLRVLPLPEMTQRIAMVLAVMPGSCGSVLIMREYGGDADFAGQLVLATTLAGFLTIPLLLTFAL